jgi:hypothetical protein
VRFSSGTALVPIPSAPRFSPTVAFCALINSPSRRFALTKAENSVDELSARMDPSLVRVIHGEELLARE